MKKIFVLIAISFSSLCAQQSPHGKLSIPCTNCHTTASWKELVSPMLFNHSTTPFALQGKHNNISCIQCHTSKKFSGTATTCFSCHQKDYAKAFLPNHQLGKFSYDCLTCHTLNGWLPSVFQHEKTNFQLTGAHQMLDCSTCHTGNRFAGLPSDCYTCHQQNYNQTTAPIHRTAQFNHDCLNCHNSNSWKPSSFDHKKTNFPLVGAHIIIECSSCHKNGQFKGVAIDCFACHQQDFTKTVTPNHTTAQYSHDCTTCHSMNGWKPSTFDHNKTNFQLLGAHKIVECSSCHKNGQYKGLATDCFTCHQQDFAKSINPNHTTAQFSHDCITCHSMNAWKPAMIDHNKTNFPLTGAHQSTDCLFCHKNGQYRGTPSDCWSCHQTDFSKVTDPNHVTGNFDHNCSTCHTTTAWKPATFDHNKTNFKLTGAHVQTLCSKCHVGGKYTGTSSDCFTCHVADYNNSTNPNHVVANYPKDCNSCHTTAVWKPSTFDHTPFFPINSSSKHSPGRWNLCSDCHTNPTSAKVFSCITCHEHNQSSMNSEHSGKSGYSYDSNACYRCHPQGR